jgi:hypothetical protein
MLVEEALMRRNMMITHCKENNVLTEEQKIHRARWLHKGIMSRCGNYAKVYNPSYDGVVVSDNFKSTKYFTAWCISQTGFTDKDERGRSFHIDKDLCGDANSRIYSEDVCVFLPAEINGVIQSRYQSKSGLPKGVGYVKPENKYSAVISHKGETTKLGYFDTPQEAGLVYNEAKLVIIHNLANKWKGRISYKAYEALMSFDLSRLIRQ